MKREYEYRDVDVVDRSTGEIVNSGTHRAKVEKEIDERTPIPFKEGEGFLKVFSESIHDLGRKLTASELTFLIMILEYVSYKDCVLREGGRKDGRVMGMPEIAAAIGMEYTRVTRLVSQLERKGVMGHHVTGSILKGYEGKAKKVYTVNPNIICRGGYVNKAVIDFYEDAGWGR